MAEVEKTLVLIKNEAIKRKLVGKILQKFEEAGLRISAMNMVVPNSDTARAHYNSGTDIDWLTGVGEKAMVIQNNSEAKLKRIFGTTNSLEIGKKIYEWSVSQLVGKEIIALVLTGPSAVTKVKKMVGSNVPSDSDMSTIRGIFSTDSIAFSNSKRRALHNVVHRSTSSKEAKREIKVWFGR